MRWEGYVACVGEINAYKMLVRKPERKRLNGRPSHEWENNIRMDLNRNMVGNCGLDASG
jgi:hypothetical protein